MTLSVRIEFKKLLINIAIYKMITFFASNWSTQSNKTKTALELFDTIQTVDRPKLILKFLSYLKTYQKHK